MVTLVGLGAVVVPPLLDRPAELRPDEVDGRTWLSLRKADGPTLVLANGISGLVEARATSRAALPADARFAGSDARFTLLRSGATAVVVGDGAHRAEVIGVEPGAALALADQSVVVDGTRVVVRPISAAGRIQDPVGVAGSGSPVPGSASVVDGHGDAWVLRQVDGTRRALRIGPSADITRSVALGADASDLLLIDGRAVARVGRRLVGLDGPAPRVADGAILPAVAVATGNRWATATDGRVDLGERSQVRLGAPVQHLAVWYGNVWAATTTGLVDVAGGAEPATVPGMGASTQMFADGGRLWFVNPTTAAAVDRDQQVTVFHLAATNLDLCVGDCSAEDAIKYIDQRTKDAPTTTTTRPQPDAQPPAAETATTTTTAPPAAPPLTLPPVAPPAVSTTAPVTTTTASVAPSTSTTLARPAAPDGTTAPTTTTPAATAPVSSTTVVTPSSTVPVTEPPVATLPPAPPVTEPPTPTSKPHSSTTQPPAGGDVILYFSSDADPLTGTTAGVVYGFTGTAQQCEGNGGSVNGSGRTVADLAWDGSTSGRQRVGLGLDGGGGSDTTTIDIAPGAVVVSVSVCGLTATIRRDVAGEPAPTLDAIQLEGTPQPGATVTASAGYQYAPGWDPASHWEFGPCGSEATLSGVDGPSSTTTTLTFAGEGRYCVNLTVTFRRAGDRATAARQATVDLSPTTSSVPGTVPPDTTPPPSTTTTTTTTTTATTAPPTTAPPSTDAPTTAPPTTAPPTTAPPTTAPPTTAPPTTAPPTTVPPTTRPTDPPTTTTKPTPPPTTAPPAPTTTTTTTG